MENSEQGAFACVENSGKIHQVGLTKREYFAGLAMQGLLVNTELTSWADDKIAKQSIMLSDELLNQLSQSNT